MAGATAELKAKKQRSKAGVKRKKNLVVSQFLVTLIQERILSKYDIASQEVCNPCHKASIGYVEVSCPVVIVDYDPRWPAIYEEEKRRILTVTGHKIIGIEHIGSTSVVGLGAKPIIDIRGGVNGYSTADEVLPLLRKIGYEDVIRQSGHSEWYYCLIKVIDGEESWLQSFHLHLVKFRSETWERHILFRDFLRGHPKTVQKYDKLKRVVAAKMVWNALVIRMQRLSSLLQWLSKLS